MIQEGSKPARGKEKGIVPQNKLLLLPQRQGLPLDCQLLISTPFCFSICASVYFSFEIVSNKSNKHTLIRHFLCAKHCGVDVDK